VFDVDGTLIDSVDAHAHAWIAAFRHFGHELPFERVRNEIGKGADKLIATFFRLRRRRQMARPSMSGDPITQTRVSAEAHGIPVGS
jgi:beta-phosphoglucomutase-like phosphatase (HAD superfamily)